MISLYLRRNGNFEYKRIDIEDFDKIFKIKLDYEKIKDDGTKVKNYDVLDEVYAESINTLTGNVEIKRILIYFFQHID